MSEKKDPIERLSEKLARAATFSPCEEDEFWNSYYNEKPVGAWCRFREWLRVRWWRVRFRVLHRCATCNKFMWFQPIEEYCCCDKCWQDWIPF